MHARKDPEVRIEVHLAENADTDPTWIYILAFRNEGKGANRILISHEEVRKAGETSAVLLRPDQKDKEDSERKTKTHLEDKFVNADFRAIADYFKETTYLHLVPQLLKYGEQIGGQRIAGDPFGQGFLESVAQTPERVRTSRLHKISNALKSAVPQFEDLVFEPDQMRHPHLKAKYTHWRHNGGWQTEDQFSDGTLRLLGLMWSLLDSDSLLLLEEPELSLNDAIAMQIPHMLHRVQKTSKRSRQIIISTHSTALLENKGIDGRGILKLNVGDQGSQIKSLNKQEANAIKNGFSVAEVVLPNIRPPNIEQLSLGL